MEEPIKRKRGRPPGSRNRPKVPAPAPAATARPGGLAEALRERVKAELRWCGCCDRARGSVSALARASGTSEPSLGLFLSGRRGISLVTLEKLWAYLDAKGTP